MTYYEGNGMDSTIARRLTARDVLDLHADAEALMTRMPRDPRFRAGMESYAHDDIAGKPHWAASHLHPATSFDDLTPWLESIGSDLRHARTYQVTEEMVNLAEMILADSPDGPVELLAEDLPSGSGFMWLDKPVPRPSDDDNGRPPLLMHAVSWERVPSLGVSMQTPDGVFSTQTPAVRIRNWSYTSRLDVFPRPLYLIGQTTTPLSAGIHTRLHTHRMIHMLWILMGMEITSHDLELPDRKGRQRAASLDHQDVTVIQLRRAKKSPDYVPKEVDWSCTWLVRAHNRRAPHGGTFKDGRTSTRVKAYLKGPDGMPLKASDILYRLSR
jgi:hypothetical protein